MLALFETIYSIVQQVPGPRMTSVPPNRSTPFANSSRLLVGIFVLAVSGFFGILLL